MSTLKKHTLEPFLKCFGVSEIVQIRLKTVPGSWTSIAETMFAKFSSCPWENTVCSIS